MSNEVIAQFTTFEEATRWLSENGYRHAGSDDRLGHKFTERDTGVSVVCSRAMNGWHEIAYLTPEFCYVFLAGNAPGERIGIIQRGALGYSPTDYDRAGVDGDQVKEIVELLNKRLGVDECTATAMQIGSMVGWSVPGADPRNLRSKFAAAGKA